MGYRCAMMGIARLVTRRNSAFVPALFLLTSLSLTACAEEAPPEEPFAHTFVVVSLDLDPTSAIGASLGEGGFLDGLLEAFQYLHCDGFLPLIMRMNGTRIGSSGRGTVELLFSQQVAIADACTGRGRFMIDPFSLESDGSARAHGPAWLEGPTFEGRIDIGTFLGPTIGLLTEDWMQLSGVLFGDPPSIDFGRFLGVWTTDFLYARGDMGRTWLDYLVLDFDVQPDVDRDGDGLEQYYDLDGDGHVDTCEDGDGTRVERTDCPLDDRFIDGYALVFVFRVVPAEVIGVAEETLVPPGILD